mmetsp:Transcript_2642/g.11568  ORF Transcript_2642/g.11568 Transcript_2642/m.11568 type:complete len:257 (+) Transcript_2642:1339-2109(+)
MRKLEIKLLVNNAASASPPGIFGINFLSTVVLTRGLLPSLGRGGRIVNVSSSSHLRALSSDMLVGDNQNSSRSYVASKLALLHFSRALRENGYNVVDVHPGFVWSPLMSNTSPKALRAAANWSRISCASLHCKPQPSLTSRPRLSFPTDTILTHPGNMRVSTAATDPALWNALELNYWPNGASQLAGSAASPQRHWTPLRLNKLPPEYRACQGGEGEAHHDKGRLGFHCALFNFVWVTEESERAPAACNVPFFMYT